ncbi:LysR substrate-binding domain-containing protein [Neomegalonema perideroedes]|uniref:LysR substrate-binding domain-containing protein n=1 Tax=Neomegalonema perideroedes TaxID=217219 RepID=UPI0003777513|nr:LysR substrate-binding domain-containing protein [Neomegalonema perideroedes]
MRSGYTPSLPELEAFVRCARLGSATRAAQELNLTQSAVSRSLASLEARVGAQLFHRVRQRLTLSDAGRALLQDAERILRDLDASTLRVMAFGGRRDLLRVAIAPCLGQNWLMPRLARFSALAPQTTFELAERAEPVDFARDPYDCALQRGAASAPETRRRPLLEERLVAAAAPELLRRFGFRAGPGAADSLSDPQIARLPLLQQAERPDLWLAWFEGSEQGAKAGADPTEIARGPRLQDLGLTLAATRAGLGAALLPEAVVQNDLEDGTLTRLSPRRLQGGQPYVLIWPEASEASRGFRLFHDWLCAETGVPAGAALAGEPPEDAAAPDESGGSETPRTGLFATHEASPFTASADDR